jgi:hypothetical protein
MFIASSAEGSTTLTSSMKGWMLCRIQAPDRSKKERTNVVSQTIIRTPMFLGHSKCSRAGQRTLRIPKSARSEKIPIARSGTKQVAIMTSLLNRTPIAPRSAA